MFCYGTQYSVPNCILCRFHLFAFASFPVNAFVLACCFCLGFCRETPLRRRLRFFDPEFSISRLERLPISIFQSIFNLKFKVAEEKAWVVERHN